jgi:hypothetical protein
MKGKNMEFNWEEFISSNNIAVHCATEEQATDFCKQMHEHGLKWNTGEQSYLKKTYWKAYRKETCYTGYGTYADLEHYKNNNYTILEWSNYEKENSMNLELTNLTDEQKQKIIELAKKFEQENALDKLDRRKDYGVLLECGRTEYTQTENMQEYFKEECFRLGLTAHTKEEAEKIRRRLLVEKELRDWAKKCKEPVDIKAVEEKLYTLSYSKATGNIITDRSEIYVDSNILFTDRNILEQAIESIGKERLIRDYFGIE